MKHKMIFVLLALLILTACATPTVTPPTAVPPTAAVQPTVAATPVSIKIAMLPILDALPFYVAQEKGYFNDQKLKVEFVPVASAAARDQLMQAGQVDGMINDLVSTMFYNKDKVNIVVVRFARTATSTYPQYRILAAKDSGIKDVNGLKGVPIAISEGSVIEYTTDRLLQAAGLKKDEIKKVAIPNIADRLTALTNGTVKAANVPDPASSAAIAAGATVIVDDTKYPQYGNSVFSFSAAFVQKNPEAVKNFLAALEKAVKDVNADKTKWNDTLTKNNLLSAALIGKYTLPDYPLASVPTEAQFKDVNDWAKEKGMVSKDLVYKESIDASYLPK
ncbi:MAG: MetQ/NlpA family ABC transporter substrate-binding protein [Chloroflexota bacterium]